jgi:acetyl esterase/lipase
VTSSAWYLVVSTIGLAFTLVALRPPRRPQWLMAATFFSAWLTSELAVWHLAWQFVATLVFIGFGALDSWLGWVGLALTLLSWSGLVAIVAGARRTSRTFATALDEALGAGWGDALDPSWAPVPTPFEWRRVVLPFAFRRKGVRRVRSIQYVDGGPTDGAGGPSKRDTSGQSGPSKRGRRRHRLDVYKRENAGPGAPVLLQIHGGAWVIGNKDQQGLPLMYHLAARGWVCVAINYRLAPRATWPAQLLDCKRALAWVRAHIAEHGGDPDYVVVTGGSAGGHLATLMGLTANDPRFQPGFEDIDTSVSAMVPFYGVYDWTNRYGQRGRRDGLRRMLERVVVKQRFADAPELFDQASPMSYIRADAPPALIVHGDLDTLAPVAEARAFVAELRATSHSPVVYAELHGAHHAFEIFQSIRTLQTVAAVDLFLTWLLTNDPPGSLVPLAEAQSSERPGR